MKRKEVFQGIISTMQKEVPFPVLPREIELPVDSGQMVTVTGVRRCGKSSMMKIVANRLLAQGVDRRRILWINFDDERLDGMKSDELDEILQAYREMFPDIELSSVYMFFDEIQAVDKWELFVMRLYKTYSKNIYITGSNAKMLSSQIATALRGWPVEYEVFPLSFGEYLRFKGVEVSRFDEAGRARLLSMCHEYLHSSAFPEVALIGEDSLKIRKVQGYFNTMLFRDLVEHYGLSNPDTVRYFIKRMMSNLTKPTSVNSIFNDLKSQGRKVDKNKLYELTEMLCEIFMFYRANRWSLSLVKESSRLPKYYFIDNGMRDAVVMPQSDDNGKLLENAVFLHLRRHIDSMQKITFFSELYECDFVVQREEHIEVLVQVCWTLSDVETRNREFRGLKTASNVTQCRNCLIITFDEEDELEYEGVDVKVMPAWKWLLNKPFK